MHHLPGNAVQCTLAWSLHACTHVKSIPLLHTKLASSAARTASFDTQQNARTSIGRTVYRRSALLHTRVVARFVLGSGDYKSSLYTYTSSSSSAASSEQLQLPYPCMWLLGVARAAWLWRLHTEALREES